MHSAFASSPPFHCAMDSMATASLTAFHPPTANVASIFPTMSGCSRTNPVLPRGKAQTESYGAVMIKKEAGTPCQVDEVTTSRKERRDVTPVLAIKAEPAEDTHKNNNHGMMLAISPPASAASSGEYHAQLFILAHGAGLIEIKS